MIPLSSLMWPKEYLNMCQIFYNNFSVIFLQHAQKRPQKSFQTKIPSVTSSVNHCLITNAIDKRQWNAPSPRLSITCMFPYNGQFVPLLSLYWQNFHCIATVIEIESILVGIMYKHATLLQEDAHLWGRRIPVSFVTCFSN